MKLEFCEASVLVHIWLNGGDGWAFHPNLEKDFTNIVSALSEYLIAGTRELIFEKPFDSGFLLGIKSPHVECKDPKANNRSPFILRVVYIPYHCSKENRCAAYGKLMRVDLPMHHGKSKALQISLPLLEKCFTELKTKIHSLEKHNHSLTNHISELEDQLGKSQSENNRLSKSNQRMDVKIEENERTINKLHDKIDRQSFLIWLIVVFLILLVSAEAWSGGTLAGSFMWVVKQVVVLVGHLFVLVREKLGV